MRSLPVCHCEERSDEAIQKPHQPAGLLRFARNDEVDGPCSKASKCHNVAVARTPQREEPSMDKISTIGFDIAKSVFQVHGVDEDGRIVLRRQLRRSEVLKFFGPRCVVGMEACASAHCWAREIAGLGHDVRLMPPTRVKPYVKWGRKNDQVDAAACYEAVTRPSMRFVPVKTVEQQAALMRHRARQLLIEQRSRLGNAIRAHLAEVGIIARKGAAGLAALLAM